MIEFEWDEEKARLNLSKHAVSFEGAGTVFGDRYAVTFSDPDHSDEEDRFITIGSSQPGRLLIVSHTDRGERIRPISARAVSRGERMLHEEER